MKALLLFAFVASTWAQLPVARLSSIFPPGAQIGMPTTVAAYGADLEDARELRFSDPRIKGVSMGGAAFTVTAATNVPPGIYDAVFVGRFGASNPRPFVISNLPEVRRPTNDWLTVDAILNNRFTKGEYDTFRLKLKKGQGVLFGAQAHELDSKAEPVLYLLDANLREILHGNGEGFHFTPDQDTEIVLKIHDSQFRGGDDFFYRLNISAQPSIAYALPAATPGAKNKITLFGSNLPNGARELEVEVDAPTTSKATYLASRPASAAIDGYEYNFPNANPIFLGFATARVVVHTNHETLKLDIPCEVQGRFHPNANVDAYEFEAAKNDVYWIEVISHRLGLNTDPFVLVQRVSKNDKGEENVSDVTEMYASDANIGGPEFNTSTRDPAYRLEVKAGEKYWLKVRDLFGQNISDLRRIYRLSIHKESPDFRLIAYSPAPPPLNKDAKEVDPHGAFLRRGDTMPIRVLALRKDGYDGDIEISAEDLPSGVTAAAAKIKAGANETILMLSSAEDATAWTGSLHIFGKAKDLKHEARYGTIVWNLADYNNEAPVSHLTHELVLNVSGAELAPLAIRSEKTTEAITGAKTNVTFTILRRHEFNNPLKFKALLEPPVEFEVDGKATNASFELDLKKHKLSPGAHTFAVYATSPGRYRRVSADEVKSIEAEIKKLKENLVAAKEAPQKDSINNEIKAQEGLIQYRDVTATVYASAAINVLPAPAKTP
jgi:hypothetical protein